MKIHVYTPEGSLPYTLRVDYADARSHIAGRSHLADEANLLLEFHRHVNIPDTLCDGKWTLIGSGVSARYPGVPFAIYSDE